MGLYFAAAISTTVSAVGFLREMVGKIGSFVNKLARNATIDAGFREMYPEEQRFLRNLVLENRRDFLMNDAFQRVELSTRTRSIGTYAPQENRENKRTLEALLKRGFIRHTGALDGKAHYEIPPQIWDRAKKNSAKWEEGSGRT